MSQTLRFIVDHHLEQWLTGKKERKDEKQKFKFTENENEIFLDEVISIF